MGFHDLGVAKDRRGVFNRVSARLLRFVAATIIIGFVFTLMTTLNSSAVSHDSFANAIELSGPAGSVSGNNIGATGEPGEPNPGANSVLNSVWYKWTAATTGSAHFETCAGRNYDTHLAAFTGTAVNALTTITANDDACGLGSIINFPAVAGTTYYIQVDGYSSSQGTFLLIYPAGTGGDTTAPTLTAVTIASNNANPALAMAGDTITLAITADEALATAPTVTLAGLPATVTGGGTGFIATLAVTAATPAGAVAINISGYADAADNTGSVVTATTNGSSVTVDTNAPSVQILGAPTSLSDLTPFDVTIEFSENVVGFVGGDVTVTNGTVSGFVVVDGNTYTATITPVGAGDVTIEVLAGVAADAAGNDNTAAVPVTVSNRIIQVTQEVIANFMLNRANHILNNQPDLTGFLNGTNGQGGGTLGNLSLNGNDDGMQLAFSTSLSKIEREANKHVAMAYATKKSDGGKGFADYTSGKKDTKKQSAKTADTYASTNSILPGRRYDIWTEVYGSKGKSGNSSNSLWVGYLGAHYFLSADLLVGGLVQVDWADETNSIAKSSADGLGWMVGPYVVGRIPDTNVNYEARAAWGRSDNTVSPLGTYQDDFETERWMASAKVSGSFMLGTLMVKPSAKVSYFHETQESYTDSLTNIIPSQTIALGEVRFGPEFIGSKTFEDGTLLQTSLGISGVWNFGIKGNATSQGFALGNDDLRTRLDAGIAVTNTRGWKFTASAYYDGLGISDYEAMGGKILLSIPIE